MTKHVFYSPHRSISELLEKEQIDPTHLYGEREDIARGSTSTALLVFSGLLIIEFCKGFFGEFGKSAASFSKAKLAALLNVLRTRSSIEVAREVDTAVADLARRSKQLSEEDIRKSISAGEKTVVAILENSGLDKAKADEVARRVVQRLTEQCVSAKSKS